MKFAIAILLGAAAAALGAGPAAAQAQDKDAAKKKILEEVEKRLKLEEEKLLKDLEKVIDEELGGKKAEPAKPEAKPPAAPPRKARGYLGIRGGDLSDDEKKSLGVKGGLRISEVIPDGPAAKAGLKAGDVLTQVDGRSIDASQDLQVIIQAAGPGTKVAVEYLRDGKKGKAEVTLGRNPQDPPEEAPKPAEPKGDDLRERVKKFLQKEEAPKQEEPKAEKPNPPAAPDEDFFAMDEEMFEQIRGLLEQFGMDPEQFFEKGKDGKYRLNSELRELVKGLNLDKLKDLLPGGKKPEPEPEPAPKVEPRKVEPKKAEPKPAAPRAWLGLQPEEVSEELRAQLDLEEGVGLLLADVVSGSPADKAGLKKNDIITQIDGKAAKGEAVLAAFMASAKPGQEVTLTILRKGKPQSVKVTLGQKNE
jgi:S1-C subfamily serine protease